MRILFIHQNFPGQFVHIAPAMAERGHEVVGLTASTNKRPSPVPVLQYVWDNPRFDPQVYKMGTTYMEMAHRGSVVASACAEIKARGFVPDLVFGHFGWGETLFIKDVWRETKLLAYAEFCYREHGLDTNFDPEFSNSDWRGSMWRTSRQAHILHAIHSVDAMLVPTRFQASTFPDYARARATVIHDGVDTDRIVPAKEATVQIPGTKLRFRKGDELLTFVNRNLEPYRGYHIMMRALPKILKERPNAQVVMVGDNGVSYGVRPPGDRSWKQIFLDEVKDQIDLSRVHFVGQVPYQTFIDLMRVSRVHAYLTYPFVLSWSMLEAMSAGALVIGSRTPPVEEVIEHGKNGLLVDFFDVPGWSDAIIEGLADTARYDGLREAARATVVDQYDLRRICLPKQIAWLEGFKSADAAMTKA